jgi:hypothetical protein
VSALTIPTHPFCGYAVKLPVFDKNAMIARTHLAIFSNMLYCESKSGLDFEIFVYFNDGTIIRASASAADN